MAGMKKNYRCVPALPPFYGGGPYALSSDASFMACALNDEVKIVDVATASVTATLAGDSEDVTAIALSPNPEFHVLFTASRSLQIRVWDLSTFTCIRSWKAHTAPVRDMACHPSGRILATAGADRNIFVWDVDTSHCTHFFRGHQGVVTTLMFHPEPLCPLLFSGSDDTTVRVWDLNQKKCLHILEKHFSTVTSLAISEDKLALLSAGRDKVVNIWDLEDYGVRATTPTLESLECVCSVPSSSNLLSLGKSKNVSSGKQKKAGAEPMHFLTVGEHGIVRIWYSEGAVCLYEQKSTVKDEMKGGFISAMLLPSTQGVMCVTGDQRFLFYDPIETLNGNYELEITRRLIGCNEEITDLKFLGDEERSLAVATNVEQIRIYDLDTMSCTHELSGHKDIVLSLDTITYSGHDLLVSGSKDHTARIWDIGSGSCICVAEGHMGPVAAVTFSRKSKSFFATGSSDRTIKIWSFANALDFQNFGASVKVSSIAAVAAHDKDINSLAIAPNDKILCSGSQDRTARLWRLPDLVPLHVLRGHKRGIWCVEFSPVDQCVMTASGDKTIKIWALIDGSCLKTFEGHTASVLRASFISHGTQLISSGADGLVKLWTIKSNECIATFDQHEDKIWALAVGRKTEKLATGGGDSLVNIWHDCTIDDEEELLTRQEELAQKDQELSNALLETNYEKAIQLAFELKRPYKLYNVFTELYRKENAETKIQKVLNRFGEEELRLLLEYVRDWNTKPKFCHVAQSVLFQLFNTLPPTEILKIRGISELLEGLVPYSQRHYSRIERLLRGTFLLDYTLSAMSVLTPQDANTTIAEDNERNDVDNSTSYETNGLSNGLTSNGIEDHSQDAIQKVKDRAAASNGADTDACSDLKNNKSNGSADGDILDNVLCEQGNKRKISKMSKDDQTLERSKKKSKKTKTHNKTDKKVRANTVSVC